MPTAPHILDVDLPEATPTGEPTVHGGSYQHIQTNPNMFGGAMAGAEEKLGEGVTKAADTGLNILVQRQGMINETLATNAETQYMTELGAITGKQKALTGLAAYDAVPDTTQQIQQLRQKYLQTLPNFGAQRAFNMLALRHEGYALSDVQTYAASQIKVADLHSAGASSANAIDSLGNIDVASNPVRTQHALDDIKYATIRQMQNQGWNVTLGADGKPVFPDTPEGQQSRDVYQKTHDAALSMAYDKKYTSLANVNVLSAYKDYQEHRADIPPEAQAKLDNFFTPKVRDAQTRNVADGVIQHADAGYSQATKTQVSGIDIAAVGETGRTGREGQEQIAPDTAGSKSYGILGLNSKTGSAAQFARENPGLGLTAAPGTAEFDAQWRAAAATKTDDLYAAQKSWYNTHVLPSVDKTLSGVAPEIAGDQRIKSYMADRFVQMGNVGLDKALAAAKDAKTPEEFIAKVSAADKANLQDNFRTYLSENPQNAQGLLNRIDRRTQLSGFAAGSPVQSRADYYRENYDTIINTARTTAEQQHPDDPRYSDLVVAKVEQRIGSVIRQQDMQVRADQDRIQHALSGDMSDHVRPTSIEQLVGIGPEVKQAWDRLQIQNPLAANLIETRILTANAKSPDFDNTPTNYYDLFKRVTSTNPNDPTRITDPTKLLEHSGGDQGLLPTDVGIMSRLVRRLNGPEGGAEAPALAQFVAKARSAITNTNEQLHTFDPKGDAMFVKFMRSFLPAYERARAAGKNPADLLNENGHDYMGATVALYMRPENQKMNDTMNSELVHEAMGGPKPAAGLDTSTPQGLRGAVLSGKMTRAQAEKIALEKGWIRPNPQPTGPQAPISQ